MNALCVMLALIVAYRAFRVIYHMDFKRRSVPYPQWLGFGISYAVLAITALGSALHILQAQGNEGDWLWLVASAGLIVFDRRARREQAIPKEKSCTTES